MEKDSTIFLPFHGCWFPSLERQRVGFKQDERKLSWGFRHEVGLMRDLSGLSPLRFLPLRPKKKKTSPGSGELHESPSPQKLSTLLWTRTLPLGGTSENSKIQCFKCKQQPTCRPSPRHILWCYGPQFSSVAQSYPTPCDPVNCSTPGLPVHHQLLEFTQTHVHRSMSLGDIKKDQFRFHSFAKCRPFWSNTVRAISSGLLFA